MRTRGVAGCGMFGSKHMLLVYLLATPSEIDNMCVYLYVFFADFHAVHATSRFVFLYTACRVFLDKQKRSLFITICFRNDQSAARVHSLFRLPRSLELQSVPLYSTLTRSQSHVDGFFVFVELVHFLEQLGHLRVTVANFREYALRRARVCPRHYFSCFAPHIYIVF